MSRLIYLFVSCVLTYSSILAQSETELLLQFDSLYDARNTPASIEMGEKWKDAVLQKGIRDTIQFITKVIRIADGYRFLNQSSKGLETLNPLFALVSPNTAVYPDLLKIYGFILLTTGEHWKADSFLVCSKAAYERQNLDHSIKYNSLLRSIADNKYGQRNIPQALKWYDTALAHRQKNKIPEDFSLGAIYSGMALCNQDQGNFVKASYWISKCIDSYSRFLPPDHPSILSNKSVYANFLLESGQLYQADSITIEVLKDLKKSGYGSSAYYGGALESHAAIRARLGQDADAFALLVEAGKIFEHALGPTHAVTLHNKLSQAKIRLGLGFIHEAQAISLEVKNTLLSDANSNQMDLAETLSVLADCTQNVEEAISLQEEALKICQTASGKPDCGILNQVPLKLAFSYLKSGSYSKCAQLLDLASDSSEFASVKNQDYLRLLFYRAQLGLLQENWSAAYESLRELIKIQKEMTAEASFILNENDWLDQLRFMRRTADMMFTAVQYSNNQPDEFVSICLDFQIFNKAISLLSAQKIREHIQIDSNLAPIFNHWCEVRAQLAWCYTQTLEVLKNQQLSLPNLEVEADSLEKVLLIRSAGFAKASLRNSATWLDIQKKLQHGEAAIEIAHYSEYQLEPTDLAHYAVMVITKEEPKPIFILLPAADQIDQFLIEKYLIETASHQGKGQTADLYRAFWSKIEPYLKDISRVYISADGGFLKISIGAILLPDGQYVADRYDIRNVFSLRDFGIRKGQKAVQGASKTAYLVGNPMFLLKDQDDVATATFRSVSERPDSIEKIAPLEYLLRNTEETRGLNLSSLPGSAQEVNDIASLMQKRGWETTVLLGVAAKEDAVKLVQSPTVLHLATHGYFLSNVRSGTANLSRAVLENNPMLRSMLFFAGAQNTLNKNSLGKEDGILSAYEAQNLHLDKTELVVLSACQTAQGKIQNGEGVYGLQRALRIAGAKAVLVSLWDVDDKVGRAFMTVFYEKWLGGMGKQEAFREAQLEVKKNHPLPFYWAGFVLFGE